MLFRINYHNLTWFDPMSKSNNDKDFRTTAIIETFANEKNNLTHYVTCYCPKTITQNTSLFFSQKMFTNVNNLSSKYT